MELFRSQLKPMHVILGVCIQKAFELSILLANLIMYKSVQ